MAKNKISVSECIKQVFKIKKELEYNDLLDDVKKLFSKENGLDNVFEHTSEFNERIRNLISKGVITYYYKLDLDFSEFTNTKVNIPRNKIKCLLCWINQEDKSVHNKNVSSILNLIKQDFARNIIKEPITETKKDYSFSKIEYTNNSEHKVLIDFYSFKNKADALKLFQKESTFGYDVPYKEYFVDEINKVYKFNINYPFKTYIIYSDKNIDWTDANSNLNSKCLIFVAINNFYIKYQSVFNYPKPDVEYGVKLIYKLINSISKKKIN